MLWKLVSIISDLIGMFGEGFAYKKGLDDQEVGVSPYKFLWVLVSKQRDTMKWEWMWDKM